MTLITLSEFRDVTGITDEQTQRILDFLQGAVYCWCKNRPNEWFSMRSLMGGENFDWDETPLNELYLKHLNKGKDNLSSIKAAGIDSGWLLKSLIGDDIRTFETRLNELIRQYRWVK